MERLNDAAFLVVIAIVALIAVRLARPWTAALPGLVGGALLGLTLRPRQAAVPTPAVPTPPGSRPRPRRNPTPGARPRPRRNPGSRYRAPRRGRVAQPRKRWRRLSTPPDRPAIRGRARGQERSRITTGMSRLVLRW